MLPHKAIYTIGHSTHTIAAFTEMLQSFHIGILADIRRYPSSRRHPQFNKAALQQSLSDTDIQYIHLAGLGGKRQPDMPVVPKGSAPFHSYKAHMETEEFRSAIEEMQGIAGRIRLAYMCAEANWRNCHRSQVSDYLKQQGWQVIHITGVGASELHADPIPVPVQGSLF